jgi:hypothetical protein
MEQEEQEEKALQTEGRVTVQVTGRMRLWELKDWS